MTDEELSHISGIIIEVVNLRHENRKLRDAIAEHKNESDSEFCTYIQRDRKLWELLK